MYLQKFIKAQELVGVHLNTSSLHDYKLTRNKNVHQHLVDITV